VHIAVSGERDDATGRIRSLCFRDPDGLLVEVTSRLSEGA
jgi:hypothetical protein